MEKMKTTELFDLLIKLTDKTGRRLDGYEEALEELKNREPFFTIFNEDWDEGLPEIFRQLEEINEAIKKLKRHKHDDKTGDVMARI